MCAPDTSGAASSGINPATGAFLPGQGAGGLAGMQPWMLMGMRPPGAEMAGNAGHDAGSAGGPDPGGGNGGASEY